MLKITHDLDIVLLVSRDMLNRITPFLGSANSLHLHDRLLSIYVLRFIVSFDNCLLDFGCGDGKGERDGSGWKGGRVCFGGGGWMVMFFGDLVLWRSS